MILLKRSISALHVFRLSHHLVHKRTAMTQPNMEKILGELRRLGTNRSYEKIPLIVIIGATGCGKTKLSIELAQRYGGEVISADSMQIYKGLDIATNKATVEEQAGVPHYLLNEVDPFKQFTVLDFQKRALQAIDCILDRHKIPIIVGGTNYYIESILWDTLVGSAEEFSDEELNIVPDSEPDESINPNDAVLPEKINSLDDLMRIKITYRRLESVSNEALHKFLSEVDPKSAEILHPQNKRKVIRCLQVFQQTGKRFSDILASQRESGSRHGGPLRFPNAIIFWVDCEKTVLDKRLDDRVDQMMKLGLLKELHQFHKDYNDLRLKQNKKADYTEGIFQAIGLKEFHNYLLLDEESRNSYDGSLVLGNGIILLKQRTKSYVTKQLKWIRRRFLVKETIRKVPNVYRMDTTEPEKWNELVRDRAIEIVNHTLEALVEEEEAKREEICAKVLNPLRERVEEEVDDAFVSGQFYCDICHVSVSGGKSYQMHLRSKGHAAKVKANKVAESLL